jgi:hypothetical protein
VRGPCGPGRAGRTTAWHLLADDCDHADLGGDDFVRRDAGRARQRAVAQLQALDTTVTLEPPAHDTGNAPFRIRAGRAPARPFAASVAGAEAGAWHGRQHLLLVVDRAALVGGHA